MAFLLVLAVGWAFTAGAQGAKSPSAVLLKLKGAVHYLQPGSTQEMPVSPGDMLFQGTTLKTGDDGLAMVKMLDDNSILRVAPKSVLVIKPPKDETGEGRKVKVNIGSVLFNITKKAMGNRFDVATPTCVATVKGTRFWVLVKSDTLSSIILLEGALNLLSPAIGKNAELREGETATSTGKGITVAKTNPADIPKDMENRRLRFKFTDNNNESHDLDIEFEDQP
jgi:hypothetical protein